MTLISKPQKREILKKARSGDYYIVLTKWSPKHGQHILIWPTNKGLSKNITYHKNIYQVYSPTDKLTNNQKKSGKAYKTNSGMFIITNVLSNIIES